MRQAVRAQFIVPVSVSIAAGAGKDKEY